MDLNVFNAYFKSMKMDWMDWIRADTTLIFKKKTFIFKGYKFYL